MHVEAMAQRSPEFDVVSRDVTASSRAGAGNRVAVPIKSIVLNERECLGKSDAVAQTVVLVVVNEIVMDVMIDSAGKTHGGVAKAR